jgi:hypothetical protein
LYLSGLAKEVKIVEHVNHFRPFLEILQIFKGLGADVEFFSQELSLQISLKIMIFEVDQVYQEDSFEETLQILLCCQNLNLSLNPMLETFINQIVELISKKNILTRPSLETLPLHIKILKILNEFEITDARLRNNLTQTLSNLDFRYNQEAFSENETNFVSVTDNTLPPLDLSKFTWVKLLGDDTSNPNYDVQNHEYTENGSTKIIRKIYKFKNINKALVIMDLYIRASDYLSSLPHENNCFVNHKGSTLIAGNGADICSEYFHFTLFSKLTSYKATGNSLTEDYIKHYSRNLANSFAIMEKVHLFHQNINPYTVSMTENWELKLNNSELFYIKNLVASLAAENPVFANLDMNQFRAPEIMEGLVNGRWERINRQKSDVFSFGLLMLFIYKHEWQAGLNLKENHGQLMEIVSQVNFTWLREALKMTLQLKQYERCTFTQVSEFLSR